jgi:cation transport ATPase
MAKNSTPYDPYRSQQEAIRKAKGNPNKNIHHKKNNSNYGGGDYQKEKAALKSQTTEKVKLPLWLKITLGVLFGVLLAALVLRMTVYKESLFMNYLTSLLLGLACAALFYTRRFRNSKKDGKLYSVITVLLAIMAVIYGGMGLLGLLTYFGIV